MKNHRWFLICIGIILLAASLACNFSSLASDAGSEATSEALATSIAGNATLAAEIAATPQAEQAQPAATETATSIPTTEAAQETSPAVEPGPTEAVPAEIRGELSLYGIDPAQGQLGWVHPPLSLEVDEYRGTKFETEFPLTVAKDFVLASDITWDTEYGGSGCGFIFRSDGKTDAPSQYLVVASRLADGHVFFAVMSQGQLVVGKDFYANGIDPKFDATNGSTNRLTVVGQGMDFTIYSNGTMLGEANPNDPLPTLDLPEPPPRPDNMLDPTVAAAYRRELASHRAVVNRLKNEYDERLRLWRTVEKDFERGFVAMGVAAQSGRTQCEFNNSWLWLLNEP